MASIRKTHLLAAVLCLLFGWTSSRALPEKLSSGQKAPHFANSSAGRSLALPRSEESSAQPESADEASALEQFLSRLRLKVSGQTPADTSLLPRKPQQQSRRGGQQNLLELLHIKASGQTPADTSLLPRRRAEPESAKSHNGAAASAQQSAGSQSRRAGQGSAAHVTIVNSQNSADVSSSGLTPANVGLLGKPSGKPPPQPAAAPQEEGVQRQEMSSFKEVNGESVRVVVGNYGYDSPEGLPVSFKYMSDENGNQASFTIGAAGSGGGAGGGSKGGAGGTGGKGKGAGAGSGAGGAKGGAGGAKGGTGGAKGGPGDADRKYLPPK